MFYINNPTRRLWRRERHSRPMYNPTSLIVIARYNEKLKWLSDKPFSNHNVLVYNKGVNEDFYPVKHVVRLDNVGREGHSYLYHIVNHYDDLTDIIIFLPGSVNMSHKIEKSKMMLQKIEETKKAVFPAFSVNKSELYDFKLDEYMASSPENNSINNESTLELARIRPFGQWFQSKFGDYDLTRLSYGGVLSVSKKDVLQHPKSFYEKLLEELSHSSNPEVGHYVERSWQAIFSMKDTLIL
jgi:hypothetical protein